MTSARDEMLARIRGALRDVPSERADAPLSRDYRLADPAAHSLLVEHFAERVAEYRAVVRRVDAAGLPEAIGAALARRGAVRVVVPADLPEGWLPSGAPVVRDGGMLSHADLDGCDGVISACALGIAQTGTIVLDHGPGQGRRAITLLPDYHLCVVWERQIVGLLPEAIARLEGAARERRPLTFISGPSATSDIELNRVEGVHGPRTLEVLLVAEGSTRG
ncbi:MAG TPA: lactate utilization protein C [Roseiflexaceae bacterium]|nr:lactate utilization protein C [Roseiflexaceae bacterium]